MALNTAVLYGSHRRARKGIGLARYLVQQLEHRGHTANLLDADAIGLPLLDLMYKEYEPDQAPASMKSVAEALVAADGFVVVSAEYNHSIPPGLKNLLDHYQVEYHDKPSGVVTYSQGPFGGVRGLVNLRGILAELGTPAIPSSLPVSAVHRAFSEQGELLEAAYEKRTARFLDEFEWYAAALKLARRGGVCSEDDPLQQLLCRGH